MRAASSRRCARAACKRLVKVKVGGAIAKQKGTDAAGCKTSTATVVATESGASVLTACRRLARTANIYERHHARRYLYGDEDATRRRLAGGVFVSVLEAKCALSVTSAGRKDEPLQVSHSCQDLFERHKAT